jgi:hypothetical protein
LINGGLTVHNDRKVLETREKRWTRDGNGEIPGKNTSDQHKGI